MSFDRSQMVKVAKTWQSAVVDFTKRNNLLFFKSKTVTVDLSSAPAKDLNQLLSGSATSLKSLVAPAMFEDAQKVAGKLLSKQKFLLEELGVSPLFVAIGFCSWVEAEATGDTPEEKTTNAPIYLFQIELENKRSSQEGWRLKPVSELKLNGVITHAAIAAGIKFDEDAFLANLPEIVTLEALLEGLPGLEKKLQRLDGFKTDVQVYLAAFGYQNEAIYRDLTDIDGLMESEIVRALAGDTAAITKLQRDPGIALTAPDYVEPNLENLILDADSSQIQVINTAMAGHTVVIQGPPGTGKSQTIANLLAESLATGKRVLFVAQKRAAITAVLARLENQGLGSLVLDVYDSSRGPQVAAQIKAAYENMNKAQQVDTQRVHDSLTESRGQLVELKDAFTSEIRGLGLTLAELQNLYYKTDAHLRPEWRLSANTIERLTDEDFVSAKKAIRQATDAQAFKDDFLVRSDSWNVETLRTSEAISGANKLALAFSSTQLKALKALPVFGSLPVTAQVFYAQAVSYVSRTWLTQYSPKLLAKSFTDDELNVAIALLSGKASDTDWGTKFQVRIKTAFSIPGDKALKLQAVTYLRRLLLEGSDLEQSIDTSVEVDFNSLTNYLDNLELLFDYVQGIDIEKLTIDEFVSHVSLLARDTSQYRIAKYWEADETLTELGIDEVLAELNSTIGIEKLGADETESIFEAAAAITLIEHALMEDPRIRGLDAETLDRIVRGFFKAERAHLKQNAAKIQRIAAENFQTAINENPVEHQNLHRETTKSKAHKPLRELLRLAPQLLVAANPIWAMSPIQVADLLPRKKLFDLVIFDEASQIQPEMAIPAIMRGDTVVVAGDSNQLPPTNFFSGAGLAITDEDEDALVNDSDSSITETSLKDSESILEAMEGIVGTRNKMLSWHYRSHDERLIALSNIEIYGNSLTTFPASNTPDALRHVLVSNKRNKAVASNSQNDEAMEVVELIKQHTKSYPTESLGVITFGVKHLAKVEMALADAKNNDKELAAWLGRDIQEEFFLKNLERVQGDERDAIIISTGYGKDETGKMSLRWGPLTRATGRRRLNVAISRAKERMTLVSNFTLADLSELKVTEGTGVELYKKFMDYLSNDGASYQNAPSTIPLNSFELDIKRRLEAEGLKLVPQFGVGNYRIDFAVRDPRNSDNFVLAIEADGATYHSGHIARERDRLRQMLLEARGWTFHRIWSTDWFSNPDREVSRVLEAYQSALDGVVFEGDDFEDVSDGVIEAPVRSLPRPEFGYGTPITEYSPKEIDYVVRYLLSDGLLLSDDDIIKEASKEIFGFTKIGSRIKKLLTESIERVQGR